jgi:glycine hydroxymethyltransferase
VQIMSESRKTVPTRPAQRRESFGNVRPRGSRPGSRVSLSERSVPAGYEFDALASPRPVGSFFHATLAESDPVIANRVSAELERQEHQIELVAPKNYMSRAVFQAHSSVVALTTIEGYAGKRMHAGMKNMDAIERLAIERAKDIFRCGYANVQPHSGTQANQAVYFALLEPGDQVLSLALSAGGHLSHGLPSNMSGKWFPTAEYDIDQETGLIDYDAAQRLANELRPKLIVTGASSYPRVIDYARLREIADSVGAVLLADIAHVAGLVAAGVHPNPFPHAHIVTTTTNKSLRGPRGGLILAHEDFAKKLDRALFPGIQGGPIPEMICAKAVALGEVTSPEFADYGRAVLDNARTLSAVLADRGYEIVTGGTDTPLVVVDLRRQGLTGAAAQRALEAVGITCNRNLVPGDTTGPMVTSGLRFGTSAVTTRGFGREEMTAVAHLVADVLDGLARTPDGDELTERLTQKLVRDLAERFPSGFPGSETGTAA